MTAEQPVERFALNNDKIFYLSGGRLVCRQKETEQLLAENITRFWLEGAQTVSYMQDEDIIHVLDLKNQKTVTRMNDKSDLGDVIPSQASNTSGAALFAAVSSLKTKFPSGKYWNHPNGSNNPDGYSNTRCTHHGSCGCYPNNCKCNSFLNAIQCHGFALKLAYDYYGSSPRNWSQVKNLNPLKAGDMIRYKNNGHSIWVTGVSGDTITFADCNSDGDCKIRWGATASKSTVASTLTYVAVAPSASVEQEAPQYLNIGTHFYANIIEQDSWATVINNNGSVEIGEGKGYANELWWFERQDSDGTYLIQSMEDNRYLDVDCEGTSNGTIIKVWEYSGTNAQRWYIGMYENLWLLKPKSTPDCVLDLIGNNTANKTVTYNGTYGTLPTPSCTGYNFLGWYTAAIRSKTARR